MEPDSTDRDDERRQDQRPDTERAAELSDRAAESVGRRYDGTKETVDEPTDNEHADRDPGNAPD
jgi:hypothetical protein